MPSRSRHRLSVDVFEAVRSDTSLTPEGKIPVSMRPEWVWAALIVKRLNQERSAAEFSKRYLAAAVQLWLQGTASDKADQGSRAFEDLLRALGARRSQRTITSIATALAELVDDADANGCSAMADTLASVALAMCREARPASYAGLLWRAARARRKAGDLASAEELYVRVLSIGQRYKDHAAIVRGSMGLAIIARERGNIDTMVRLFEVAHERAQLAKSRELQILAHQGMQIAADALGDRAAEVHHVWLAYSLSIGDPVHELEAFHNVAWYACQAGIASDALPALQTVLDRANLRPALRFHFLGTAATAAAQCGRKDVVEQVETELAHFKESTANPHEYGLALISLSEALEWLGNRTAARRYRDHARDLAKRFGLNELLHRSTTSKVRSAVSPVIDSETASELDEVRRALRTIAAGVVGSAGADREGADELPHGDKA